MATERRARLDPTPLIFFRIGTLRRPFPWYDFCSSNPHRAMHIQVSPDGRLNWDYTPMSNRPGLVTVDDQDGERLLLTTAEAREHWRSYAAKGWEWI